MDIRKHNAEAWDRKVDAGSQWTLPVDREVITRARRGDWQVILTPIIPVPRDWFGDVEGMRILALASGGGQQGPVLAAAGAKVTVFDNSPSQLEQDRKVAEREGIDLELVCGDMKDLTVFADGAFDLIFHPTANCFIPDTLPVWRECHRVLRPGGVLLAGHMNPAYYIFDYGLIETQKKLRVKHRLPYSDLQSMEPGDLQTHLDAGEALEFSHTLDDLIGGQLEAGFALTGFFEDRFGSEAEDPLSRYMPVCFATRAQKNE